MTAWSPASERVEWMDDASCAEVGTELFFPEVGEPADDAKRICKGCPVRLDCLTYAMDNNEQHGLWGGLTTNQRRRLAKRNAA